MAEVADLVVRAQVGDAEAYSIIYQRFRDMAFAYAYSILGDYELAEDARQEAFLGAYCDLLALREPAAFPGWFRKIVLKNSIAIRRGRGILTVPLEDAAEIASEAPGPSQIAEKREIRGRVARAIGQLPASERRITRLFYIEGRSLREIGLTTGLARKTVKSRLHSARERLRQRLMEIVKTTVKNQSLSGDKTATRAATAEAVAQFDRELRSLLKFPSEKEQQRAGNLLCARGRILRFMGKMEDAIASFERGMSIPALKERALFQARFRAEIGLTYVQTSDYGKAKKELQASRKAVMKEDGRSPLLAAVLNGLGMCAWGEGNFRTARRFYEETARISRKARCAVLEAEAHNNLALLDWKNGRLEDSIRNFRACLQRWKEIRNRFGQALTLMNVGVVEENLGRYTPASRHYGEALALAKELNFVQVQGASNSNLGNLALNQERWSQALEHSGQGLALARNIGDRRSQAIALENLALAHAGLRGYEEARRCLEEARRIAEAIGDRERLFSLELAAIEERIARNQLEGIPERLQEALRVLKTRKYLAELPRLLRLQLRAEIMSGAGREALRTFGKALRECQKQKNRPEEKRVQSLKKLLIGVRE